MTETFNFMSESFNWIDLLIAALLLFAIIRGIQAGLVRSLFAICGLVAGLAAAKMYYAALSAYLPESVWLPPVAADTLSFLAIFVVAAAFIHYCGSLIAGFVERCHLKTVNRLCGGVIGLAVGIVLVGALLIMLTAFPLFTAFPDHINQSYLAQPIIEYVRLAYNTASKYLNLELPRLGIYTEDIGAYFGTVITEIESQNIDFNKLDEATCFACEGMVDFVGFPEYGNNLISPKFVCLSCGRTSDGCQTYEGYHAMYEQCPVELGNRGYRFDCGIWSNNSYHRPNGPCPVCGTP